jgi:hypothetical protein
MKNLIVAVTICLLSAQTQVAQWGEIMTTTPVDHPSYNQYAAEYRYWSDEAERQVAEAISEEESE